MSSAYRKPHTCWQHRAALTGGVTYREPARTTTRPLRIRRIRVAGLLVVLGARAAALGHQSLGSSSTRRESMSRKLWPLAALATVGLIGAGCSNGSAENGNPGT